MSGTIVGLQGFQRSGKTLLAYMLSEYFRKQGMPVYSNVYCKDFHYINSLNDYPFNLQPKVLFIDEIYNGADAQDWKTLKDISILVNTLGKQNTLFIYTTINIEMVYNRIRNQTQIAINVKSDKKNIYYQWVNLNKQIMKQYTLPKTKELFKSLNYDTNFVPLEFDMDMTSFKSKLVSYYRENYPEIVKYIVS